MKEKQERLSRKYGEEYPEHSSLHGYIFSEEFDTNEIAAELRKLPFVRTAYPTPVCNVDSNPSPDYIWNQGLYDIHYNLPYGTTDPYFNDSETPYWWQFNRHKVFQAWYIYSIIMNGYDTDIMNVSQSDKPIITVIDNGFYEGAGADAPTYFIKRHFDSSGYVDMNIVPTNNEQVSHGTMMASVIASPKNNSYGTSGIIPGARISGFKADSLWNSTENKYQLDTNALAHAIGYAANSTTDVVSISVSSVNSSGKRVPLIYDPVLSAKIEDVIDNNIPVVISAGNTDTNLDNEPAVTDVGQIIVGATDYEGGILYNGPNSVNSAFGKIVDLAAAGDEIYATNYDKTLNVAGIKNASGTSVPTAMVAATIGMMKRIATKRGGLFTPENYRNMVSYTGTLAVSNLPTNSQEVSCSSPAESTKKFMGRYLAKKQPPPFSNDYNNINLFAEIRELNVLNAVIIMGALKTSTFPGYETIVRIFNNDDVTWATTNGDWNGRYATENYFEEYFYGFSSIPSGTELNFFTANNGGNGSLGYQVYRNGYDVTERIYGVVSRYNTASPNQNILTRNGIQYWTFGPGYYETGCDSDYDNQGWFGGWTYIHP